MRKMRARFSPAEFRGIAAPVEWHALAYGLCGVSETGHVFSPLARKQEAGTEHCSGLSRERYVSENGRVKVIRGYKTEVDLTNEQRTACLKHAGCARFAYNFGLARSQEVYRLTGKRPTAITLHKELNALKPSQFPWMYEVSKCAPQEALRDVEQGYKHFYRKLKLKKIGQFKGKLGFPTWKKRSKAIGSFRLTGSIKVFSDATTRAHSLLQLNPSVYRTSTKRRYLQHVLGEVI